MGKYLFPSKLKPSLNDDRQSSQMISAGGLHGNERVGQQWVPVVGRDVKSPRRSITVIER